MTEILPQPQLLWAVQIVPDWFIIARGLEWPDYGKVLEARSVRARCVTEEKARLPANLYWAWVNEALPDLVIVDCSSDELPVSVRNGTAWAVTLTTFLKSCSGWWLSCPRGTVELGRSELDYPQHCRSIATRLGKGKMW